MAIQTRADVPNKIRGIAAEKRVRQADLAEALHVSKMSITRRLNGSVPFTADELIDLGVFLNVPVGAFFGEVAA